MEKLTSEENYNSATIEELEDYEKNILNKLKNEIVDKPRTRKSKIT